VYIRRRPPRSVNDSMHGNKHGNKHGKTHDQHTNLHSDSLRPRILHLLSIATGASPNIAIYLGMVSAIRGLLSSRQVFLY
jgi:hypothetical protein